MIFKLMKNEFFLEKKSSFNLLYISFFAISCLMFLLFSFPLAKINDSTVFAGFFWINCWRHVNFIYRILVDIINFCLNWNTSWNKFI